MQALNKRKEKEISDAVEKERREREARDRREREEAEIRARESRKAEERRKRDKAARNAREEQQRLYSISHTQKLMPLLSRVISLQMAFAISITSLIAETLTPLKSRGAYIHGAIAKIME